MGMLLVVGEQVRATKSDEGRGDVGQQLRRDPIWC